MSQQNKIQNPAVQLQKTPDMNDRDFINDMLATEKYMTWAYSTALNETSYSDLYQDVLDIFTETQNCQRELFEIMFKKGWYGFEAADQQKLQQSHQQFQSYSNQFPYNNQQIQ